MYALISRIGIAPATMTAQPRNRRPSRIHRCKPKRLQPNPATTTASLIKPEDQNTNDGTKSAAIAAGGRNAGSRFARKTRYIAIFPHSDNIAKTMQVAYLDGPNR